MHEIMPFGIDLIKRFAAPLGKNEMTGSAVTRFDRHLPVGCNMLAIVATETSVPIFMSDEVGMCSPIGFYFGKKVFSIDGLRFIDNRIRLPRIGISLAQGRRRSRAHRSSGAHRSRPRSYLRAQTGDCEVPRSARNDRWEATTAPDRPGTGTKDKSCRARNILRRLPQSA